MVGSFFVVIIQNYLAFNALYVIFAKWNDILNLNKHETYKITNQRPVTLLRAVALFCAKQRC